MQPYKPSNKAPLGGLALLVGGTAVVGIIVGAITSFLSGWIYLIILFPLIMGGIVAGFIAFSVKRGKIRSPILVGLVGLLLGTLTYASLHYFDYQALIREEVSYWTTELGAADGEIERGDVVTFVDEILVEETGSPGVWGFVKLQAQEGISVGDVGASEDQMVGLGSIGTWIYFAVELGILALVPAFIGFSTANEPFSEVCDTWYDLPDVIGQVPQEYEKELKQALKNGSFEQAIQMMQADLAPPCLRLTLADVNACDLNEDQVLTVQRVSLDRKKRQKTRVVLKGLVTHTEAEMLKRRDIQQPAAF